MAKRIPGLSFDDLTYEGSGPTVEAAVEQAVALWRAREARAPALFRSSEATFDLFTRVIVADGKVIYHAILRR